MRYTSLAAREKCAQSTREIVPHCPAVIAVSAVAPSFASITPWAIEKRNGTNGNWSDAY